MWMLRVRLSFVNPDLDQTSVLHCFGNCHSQRNLFCVMAVIFSVWKPGIHLRLSCHPRMLFGSWASCQKPVVSGYHFLSHFRQTGSGWYE